MALDSWLFVVFTCAQFVLIFRNCRRCIEFSVITCKLKNLVGFSGFASWPPWGLCPLDPRWDSHYVLTLPRLPCMYLTPTFIYPLLPRKWMLYIRTFCFNVKMNTFPGSQGFAVVSQLPSSVKLLNCSLYVCIVIRVAVWEKVNIGLIWSTDSIPATSHELLTAVITMSITACKSFFWRLIISWL